jgi:hypothetical protein
LAQEIQFFQGIESFGLIVKRLRPKAFSPVCLFRFLRNSAIFPHYDTVSWGRGKGEDGNLLVRTEKEMLAPDRIKLDTEPRFSYIQHPQLSPY